MSGNFKYLVSSLVTFMLFMLPLSSKTKEADSEKPKVSFAYDVDFLMQFDNREFSRSDFTPSMTIFGARITPSVGVHIQQNKGLSHKLMVGVDVRKDFGKSPVSPAYASPGTPETDKKQNNLNLFNELTLYYSLEKDFGKTKLSLHAGIFPRKFSEGMYSRAFFSDSLLFYDSNYEGMLVKIHRPKAYFEAGCDWMGQYGTFRRERFMLFSAGAGQVAPVLSLGYSAYLYHFSCSEVSQNVVDNILLNPYLHFEFAHLAKMQILSFRLGWLQGMQNDRANVGKYVFPCGAELDIELKKWNVGIRNELFFGKDMLPYYNSTDVAGYKYGELLYLGSPFYRVHDDEETGFGLSDRLEVYYAPPIGTPYLNIKISAIFHFNGREYSGCRQMVSLKFNLQELLNRQKNKK